jgi:mRNA interferase MazF
MNVRRGDVVLVAFPYSSGAGAKKRPVLVIQDDRDKRRLTNTIVAQITSNRRRANESTHLLIEVTTPEWKRSGLLQDSVVSCVNLATIAESRIERTIGSLSAAMMAKVNDCLKAALELP